MVCNTIFGQWQFHSKGKFAFYLVFLDHLGQVLFGETLVAALALDGECVLDCDWEKARSCITSPSLLKGEREKILNALAK